MPLLRSAQLTSVQHTSNCWKAAFPHRRLTPAVRLMAVLRLVIVTASLFSVATKLYHWPYIAGTFLFYSMLSSRLRSSFLRNFLVFFASFTASYIATSVARPISSQTQSSFSVHYPNTSWRQQQRQRGNGSLVFLLTSPDISLPVNTLRSIYLYRKGSYYWHVKQKREKRHGHGVSLKENGIAMKRFPKTAILYVAFLWGVLARTIRLQGRLNVFRD